MAQYYGYEGIKDYGTFKVDATTATAIGTDLSGEENKAYAISADSTVGYGSSGDPVFGIVEKVEKEYTNSTDLVATLKLTGMKEGVPTTDVTDSIPVVGKSVCVDGSGALIVSSTTATVDVASRARAFSVDTTNCLAIIQL